ncbi:MAG: DUF1289 domain-containing protein [Gammaproteobacteria bacterium]
MTIFVTEGLDGDAPVASPCVDVCELDARSVCLGCYRHSDEIMAWPSLDDSAKQAILGRVERRRELAANEV